MLARPATFRDPGTPDQIVMEQNNLTHFPSQPWCKMCVESRGHDSPHREQSKVDAVVPQLQLDYGYMEDGGPLQMACFLVGTDTSSGAIHATMVPDSKKMDMPYVVTTTAKWVRDLGYERFCRHGDKEGVLQLLLDKVAKECRPEGQDWQILRQVSPTQSHQSNGAAEKAVSTVRGLAGTNLAVIKDKIPYFAVTTMLPWTIRHAAWILTTYNVRRDTRTTPYEKIRGQKIQKRDSSIGEQILARRPGANVNQLVQPWLTGLWLGRDTLSAEHLIGTAAGVHVKQRSSLQEPARWVPQHWMPCSSHRRPHIWIFPAALVYRDQRARNQIKPERCSDSSRFLQHQPRIQKQFQRRRRRMITVSQRREDVKR